MVDVEFISRWEVLEIKNAWGDRSTREGLSELHTGLSVVFEEINVEFVHCEFEECAGQRVWLWCRSYPSVLKLKKKLKDKRLPVIFTRCYNKLLKSKIDMKVKISVTSEQQFLLARQHFEISGRHNYSNFQ